MSDQTSTIPNGWRITTFGAEATIKGRIGWRGYTIEDLRDSGTLVIGGTQVKNNKLDFSKPVYISEEKYEESPEIKVYLHDIILTKTGNSVGDVAIVNKDIGKATINPNVALIRTTKSDPYYLYYLLLSREAQHYITSGSTASAQPAVNQDTLRKYEYYCPDINEQRAIAAILSSLNNKIDLLREQNKTLEATAQAIFKEWFVNFNFPGTTGKMIDSELGNIPEGWKVGRLSDIADFLNGLALQKYPPESSTEYLPVVKIKELNSGISEQSDRASSKLDKKYVVEGGDVLFSWSGSLLVDIWKYGKGALNQHLFKVTSNSYPKWFYFYWIKEHLPSFQQTASAKAVTMGHIQRHHLDDALVVIPNDQFMKTADATLTPFLSKLINNNSQIKSLISLRDTLLPKLIKGEVRVNI